MTGMKLSREVTMKPLVIVKQLPSSMTVMGENWRMDQQHCSDATIMTEMTE
jgi:hypothetical protein